MVFKGIIEPCSGGHLFLVAGDELYAEFAGDVVDDGLGEGDMRVLWHAFRFEANVAEFLDQGLQRHAVLQAKGEKGPVAVNQAVDARLTRSRTGICSAYASFF